MEELADLLHSFLSQRRHEDAQLDHLMGRTQATVNEPDLNSFWKVY